MAVYRCNECEEYKDADYFPGLEDPKDGCQLLCEDCYDELVDDE